MSVDATVREPSPERLQLRLLVVVARLYHIHGVRQREIGARLGMSQARVSRVLHQAEELGIVRTVVVVPEGIHPELEETIEQSYGLMEAHVVDVAQGDTDLAALLGRAAARYLRGATVGGAVVGFTSWSRTLQEMAFAFEELPRTGTRHVVEMLGDLGSPLLQHSAARATQAMATALGAEPVFLRTPGVVTTRALRATALRDGHVQRALRLLDELDIAFVGVGPPEAHGQLKAGDTCFSPRQLARVRAEGAVGQLNQRFVDKAGRALQTPLDELVVGATLQQVAVSRRRVVVAGGDDKHESMAAALTGGWVDVLLTDTTSARFLVARATSATALASAGSRPVALEFET